MCWYVCIGFVDFMFKDKTLLEYTNLLSPKKYEKNHKIILKYFSITKKLFCVICGEYRKFKNPKILYMFEKTHYFFLLFAIRVKLMIKKYLSEKESIEISKILILIKNM